MTDLDQSESMPASSPVDGRVARRERNINAVIDVVLDMFAEDMMFPTIEQAANRSGLSLRSLYRYFADPGELLEATIKRSDEVAIELSKIHAIGEGPLADRITAFVDSRLRLHDGVGPVFRATIANAGRHPRVLAEQAKNQQRMRDQFELQFETELARQSPAQRDAMLAAGDLLTQLQSVDFLRRNSGLSRTKTQAALVTGLHALLD